MSVQIPLYTYADLEEHVVDFMGANVTNEAMRDARRAIQNALRVFTTAHRWSYYYQRGRIVTNPQFPGVVGINQPPGLVPTITYTQNNLQATLSTGTWPAYAPFCTILINAIEYKVAALISTTVIQLSGNSNPGMDLPAGTSFNLYQDCYPMPADFSATDEIINATYVLPLEYVHPNQWLSHHRIIYSPATPFRYTITSHPQYYGVMAARFFPAPDQVYNMDFMYARRPRQCIQENVNAGTVSISANPNMGVLGTGTNFSGQMAGAILRVSGSATQLPTSVVGSNPYIYERVVSSVSDATDLTIDAPIDTNISGSRYVISDPVDVEDGAMLTAFLRCIEDQVSRARKMKDRADATSAYRQALTLAMEADSRSFARRAAGEMQRAALRLAYMPLGPDIT